MFADVKSSMELIAHHDPEQTQTLIGPVIEAMMEAVHRYEGRDIVARDRRPEAEAG